jgi:hypothetical protein
MQDGKIDKVEIQQSSRGGSRTKPTVQQLQYFLMLSYACEWRSFVGHVEVWWAPTG